MPINTEAYQQIQKELYNKNVILVAVSKTKSTEEITTLYHLGQKIFGENYVQELTEKYSLLPQDIQWHFIGHLQSNKVKYIAPFVSLIHSIDSEKLLAEINKQAKKNNRIVNCLLQVHIAQEETKFGFNEDELQTLFSKDVSVYDHIKIQGLMGMASFSTDQKKVAHEFKTLKNLFDKYASGFGAEMSVLSMGMSGDYHQAIEQGSNMVRIGSLIFGKR